MAPVNSTQVSGNSTQVEVLKQAVLRSKGAIQTNNAAANGVAPSTATYSDLGPMPTYSDQLATKAAAEAKLQQQQQQAATREAEASGNASVNRTVPTTTEGAILDARQELMDMKAELNSFSKYEQLAYHFRLFMTSEVDLVARTSGKSIGEMYSLIDGMSQMTIAETGVTAGYCIGEVSMEQLVGPNHRSRNVNMTKISMTVTEPLGTSFVEHIRNAALELGVQNFNKFWFYLELTFLAYDESGSVVNPTQDMNPALPNGGRWIWQVSILDIETKLDASGAEYRLTLQPYSEQSFADEVQRTPEMLIFKAKTIGEFFDSVAKGLSDAWKVRYGASINSFGFELHDILKDAETISASTMRNWPLTPQKHLVQGIRGETLADGDVPTFHVPRGTSISDMITFTFASCEEAQKVGLDVKVAGEIENKDKDVREYVAFQVESEVQVTDFEEITRQYVKKFTFHIWGYMTLGPILDEETVKKAESDSTQQAMGKILKNRGFLRKHYDYLFTGMNTEVINFDFRYNFKWNAVLPYLHGARNSAESVGLHKKWNDEVHSYKEYVDLSKILDSKMRDLEDKLMKETDQTARTTLEKEIEGLKSQRGRLAQEAEKNARKVRALNTETAITHSYVEDVSEAPASKHPLITSFTQSSDESKDNSGYLHAAQFHAGKSLFGALLDQLHGPVSQQFINISLEIRGDPYWIGPSNIERIPLRRAAPVRGNQPLPDYMQGDHTFLLTVAFPYKAATDGSESWIRRDSDIFNGVYGVRMVTHTFSGGVFKQTLDAYRITLLSIAQALGYKGFSK